MAKNYLSIYAKSFNWAGFFLPKIKYKKGTVLKPPPIPNNPATKPTGIAVKASNKII